MSNDTVQTKLVPGTYRLTEDMPPLRADKRRTSDWRYNTIKAGRLFFYTEWTYAPGDDETRTVTERRLYPIGAYSHESVAPNESLETRQLEESLTRVEETPLLWLRREHGANTGLKVLDELVATGRITLTDVQTIVETLHERARAESATKVNA